MTGNKPYQFKVLRYTHDIVSGECLNAGVCLSTADGEPINKADAQDTINRELLDVVRKLAELARPRSTGILS